MRKAFLMGAGAAFAALATPVWAQQTPDNTAFLNETINNKGLPHQAPSLALPSIYRLNPCSTGAALGVTTPLVGIGGAISTIDHSCETRNNAALAVTALKNEALARELLCNIDQFRAAFARIAQPCLADKPVRTSEAAPSSASPAAPVTPASAAPRQTPQLLDDAPAFCRQRDLDLALYPDCTTRDAPTSLRADSSPRMTVAVRRAPTHPAASRHVAPAEPSTDESFAPQRSSVPTRSVAWTMAAEPLPAGPVGSGAGCKVQSALRSFYPECNGPNGVTEMLAGSKEHGAAAASLAGQSPATQRRLVEAR